MASVTSAQESAGVTAGDGAASVVTAGGGRVSLRTSKASVSSRSLASVSSTRTETCCAPSVIAAQEEAGRVHGMAALVPARVPAWIHPCSCVPER